MNGSVEFFSKLCLRHCSDGFVTVAVRADLMTCGSDLTHQRRVDLRDPPEDKKRGLDACLSQKVEQSVGVGHDSRPNRQSVVERGLLPVLDIDRQQMEC